MENHRRPGFAGKSCKEIPHPIGNGGFLFDSFPALIGIALFLRTTMGVPVFFRQVRPGLKGRPFTIYKFRTMNNCCDQDGCLLPDAERLTRLGRLLRKTSMDALPEL